MAESAVPIDTSKVSIDKASAQKKTITACSAVIGEASKRRSESGMIRLCFLVKQSWGLPLSCSADGRLPTAAGAKPRGETGAAPRLHVYSRYFASPPPRVNDDVS